MLVVPQALQKIDIFEPKWLKTLVKTSHGRPCIPPDHEESSRGLFHVGRGVQVQV
jgi:hypothetical protein